MFKLFLTIAFLTAVNGIRISPLGIVEGIKDCGSRGRLGRVEVTDCTQVPCHFVPNNIYDVAIRFVSSISSDNLALFVFQMENGYPTVELLQVDIDGAIDSGIEYELKFQLPITTEFANQSFGIQFYIVDRDIFIHEVCAEAEIDIGSG